MLKDNVKKARTVGGMEIHKDLLSQIEECYKKHFWRGQYTDDLAYFSRDEELIQTEKDNWESVHEALKELIEALKIITDEQ